MAMVRALGWGSMLSPLSAGSESASAASAFQVGISRERLDD
jgi:hypothetical protein